MALGGSHTHLFTENSLKYLFKKMVPSTFRVVVWTDFNDLARSLGVSNAKNIASEKVISQIQNLIDVSNSFRQKNLVQKFI